MQAVFDLRGASQGVAYVLQNGQLRGEVSFSLREGRLQLERPLPKLKRALLSLPLEILNFRTMELPFKETEKVRDSLPFLLQEKALLPPEALVYDVLPLGEGAEGQHRFLAVYVEKELLQRLLEAFKAQGAEPHTVTSLELAWALREKAPLQALSNPPTLPGAQRKELSLAELARATVQLRRGELAYTSHLEALQRGLRRTALLLVLLALTLAGLLTLKSYELRAQNQQIESQLRKAYLRLQPGAQSTGPVNLLLRAKLKELQQRRQALQGLQGLELLRALAQSQGPGAELQELEATSQGLFLRGRAASAAQAEELRKALQERFPRVELLGTETLPDGQVAFRLKVSR